MTKVFTEAEVMSAMNAAERLHPPPEPGVLSKPVSDIAGVFGEMVYLRAVTYEVVDARLIELIEGFLNAKPGEVAA